MPPEELSEIKHNLILSRKLSKNGVTLRRAGCLSKVSRSGAGEGGRLCATSFTFFLPARQFFTVQTNLPSQLGCKHTIKRVYAILEGDWPRHMCPGLCVLPPRPGDPKIRLALCDQHRDSRRAAGGITGWEMGRTG